MGVDKVIDTLGLPLVVKVIDGTRGEGVAIAPDRISLKTFCETLIMGEINFVCQEFVPNLDHSLRVVVLGDKALGGVRYSSEDEDNFRSNSQGISAEPIEITPEMELVAVAAAKSLGVEFAGVDLVERNGQYLVLEANFPCNFARGAMLVI